MRVVGFCGPSGTGKTTLIGRLLPLLTADGSRVSVIKHAHGGFDLDAPQALPVATQRPVFARGDAIGLAQFLQAQGARMEYDREPQG